MNKTDKLDLPYFNSTNYPLAVRNKLLELKPSEDEAKILNYHQFIVKEFFTKTNARGLLICHGMGQGKTRLAVAISDHVRNFDSNRKIIVLSAKSLEANFRKELTAYTGQTDEQIDKKYKFISLNSSRMFKKINTVDKTDEQNELEKRLGDFMDDVIRNSSLEGSMLIVDEAHNLFNAITNGAKNALSLYDLIMKTKNLKLIFLSGTPVVNDPFELVPCFNMIRGTIEVIGSAENVETSPKSPRFSKSPKSPRSPKSPKYQKSAHEKTTTLFSEDINEFETFFVDRTEKAIKNKTKFTNRIYGLCSYYGDQYFPQDTGKPGFPKELDNIIEKVPMSQTQFASYISARILEQDETKKGYKAVNSRFSSSSGGSSTYRVKSRQISNYCIPDYALGPARGAKSREKFIDRISIDDLRDLDKFSPKMAKVLSNIKKHKGTNGIVYSQFVSGEGLGIFAKVLKAHGWYQHGEKLLSSADDYGISEPNQPKKIFGVLSGNIDPEERSKLIQEFNTPGSNIRLLLLSGAVAEGIDLKRVRHVHVMEPFWNYARINQVKTRAIRYLSHVDLPEDQQNVQVYIYLSDYPADYPKQKIKEPTTDIDLYTKSIANMQIIDSFMLAIVEASIDCSLHHPNLESAIQKKIQCKLCSPDNQLMYHPLIRRDMELPNTCTPFAEKKVDVQEIVIPNIEEKFYYKKTDDTIKLYHYNKKLNGFAPMLRTHPLYANVMEAVVLMDS